MGPGQGRPPGRIRGVRGLDPRPGHYDHDYIAPPPPPQKKRRSQGDIREVRALGGALAAWTLGGALEAQTPGGAL